MRRMDGFSAFLLNEEQPGVYQHTLKIAVLDVSEVPGGWNYDRFRDCFLRRLPIIPFARWKFVRVPFGLHHPVWVDDPDFDPDYHLRRVVCPPPGDNHALCTLISQIYAWPLDQSKPLWLCWVVEGLENDRVALVILLHHAYVDGTGAARLLERFFSEQPDPVLSEPAEWQPEPSPRWWQLLGRALVDLPVTWWESFPKIMKGRRDVRRLAEQFAQEGKEMPPNPNRDTRDSPFNILLGHGRTFVFDTYQLDYIHKISRAHELTINDLFLAAAASACRRFMQDRGFDPDTGPLVGLIPIGRRPPPDEDDCIGNLTSVDFLSVPVHLADPLERLQAAHRASVIMKEHFLAARDVDLSKVMEVMPPFVLSLMDWKVRHEQGKKGNRGNLALSNVTGPAIPLQLGGICLDNWVSMGQIENGAAFNTTIWSYAGKVNLCILADKKMLPDGWLMARYYREAFTEYETLAG